MPWPRRKRDVAARSVELRHQLLRNLEHAKAITRRELPGPLPARDADPDPATGVTDAEAS
ncbi:hypothetical protein [Nocardioides anomalus]|uniref:hypothetical protein n=1 Tax=Nocardioides anomalus TaxID=2712223 RepID=UPI001E4A9401|nr:hypothetical protein [Nocardioides anomalus]